MKPVSGDATIASGRSFTEAVASTTADRVTVWLYNSESVANLPASIARAHTPAAFTEGQEEASDFLPKRWSKVEPYCI